MEPNILLALTSLAVFQNLVMSNSVEKYSLGPHPYMFLLKASMKIGKCTAIRMMALINFSDIF